MPPVFSPTPGAQGFQQSNPCVLAIAALYGSLQLFKEAGMMPVLRNRSLKLTGRMDDLLRQSKHFMAPEKAIRLSSELSDQVKPSFTIITPSDPEARGAQLSLLFLPIGSGVMVKVFDHLMKNGVVGDEREPDVIRLAAAPLYNTSVEVDTAVRVLNGALDSLQ
jgi:kynureninase